MNTLTEVNHPLTQEAHTESEGEPPGKPSLNHKTCYSSLIYDLPKPVADRIAAWGRQNIPEDALYAPDPTYGREVDIHCTVIYGVMKTPLYPMAEMLAQERHFSIELGTVACFQNEKFDVVKVNVFGGDMYRLNDKVKKHFPVVEHFSYSPHVTIAYVKPGLGPKYVGSTEFLGLKLLVNTLRYFECEEKINYHFPLQYERRLVRR